jgi:hypothetical protein
MEPIKCQTSRTVWQQRRPQISLLLEKRKMSFNLYPSAGTSAISFDQRVGGWMESGAIFHIDPEWNQSAGLPGCTDYSPYPVDCTYLAVHGQLQS